MLFMGEEWHSSRPFQFFCDFGAGLADAVRNGRRQEFSKFAAFASEAARASIPDPQSVETFRASKLDWAALSEPDHSAVFRSYQYLLAIRARYITPLLPKLRRGGDYTLVAPGALIVRWSADDGTELTLLANLSAHAVAGFPDAPGRLLWEEGQIEADGTYPAWTLRWILRA